MSENPFHCACQIIKIVMSESDDQIDDNQV